MSESFIPVNGTNPAKSLETAEFTNTAGELVHREAVYIGDPDTFAAKAPVAGVNGDYALYVVDRGASKDAFNRSRVSSAFGILDFKHLDSGLTSQFHDYLENAVFVYSGLTGTFQVGEVVTDDTTGAEATVIADNGSALTVKTLDQHHFSDGNGITGGTSGATATLTTSNTGSLITFSYNDAGLLFSIPGNDGDKAIHQSARRASYVTGNGQLTDITFVPNATDAAEVALVIRSSTSGTSVDTRITQDNWNRDTLNGTGFSGVTLDKEKSQIGEISFQWLGHGHVDLTFGDMDVNGKPVFAHREIYANSGIVPYMRNPTLPLRWEISQESGFVYKRFGNFDSKDGVFIEYKEAEATAPLTMKATCGSVKSEGGYELPGNQFTASRKGARRSVGTAAEVPILLVRPKTQFPAGELNRRIARYLDVGGSSITNNAWLYVKHIHGLKKAESSVGVDATFADIDSEDSAFEFSTDVTIIDAMHIHEVDETYLTAGGPAGKGGGDTISGEFNDSHSFASGPFSVDFPGSTEAFAIYSRAEGGNAGVECHVTINEGT